MSILKNRLLILFFIGLTVFSGCRILPWWGDFGDSGGDDYLPGETLLSRNVAINEEIELDTSEFKLKIAANSLKSNSAITVTRLEPSISGLSWPDEFKPVGAIYNIRLAPEHETLKIPARITIAVPGRRSDTRYFVLRRSSNGELSLHSQTSTETTGFIEISTMQLSSWVVVEQKLPIAGALTVAPVLTIAPSATILPKAGVFTHDVEINTLVAGVDALSQGNGSLKLELTSFQPYTVDIAYTDSDDKSLALVANNLNRVSFDLFDATLANKSSNGNLATFTSKIRLTGKKVEDLPVFFGIRAVYTLKNGISYSGYTPVYFEQPPSAAPPALLSIIPAHQSKEVNPDTDVILQFSAPIVKSSLIQALTISPAVGIADNSLIWSEDATQARFSFTTALATGTEYTIYLGTKLEDAYGNLLLQPITSKFTTGDGLAPSVTAFEPTPANQPHATNGSIKIIFSKSLASNTAQISFAPAPANSVLFAWSANEVEIFPDPAWADNSLIDVTIAAGLADLAGNRTAEPINLSFTTGNVKFAELQQLLPADQSTAVPVDSKVFLVFDQEMKPAETENAIVFSSNFPTSRTYTWNAEGTNLEIAFQPRMKLGTEHTIEINTTAQSAAGTPLARQYSSTFFTITGIEPLVSATIPLNDATNVSLKAAIELSFNVEMDKVSVESAFSLTDENSNTVSGLFSWTGNTAVKFTPNTDLLSSKDYRVQLTSNAKDSQGYQLLTPLDMTFATAANLPAVLTAAIPANGTSNVAFNQQVVLSFSEPIAEDSFGLAVTPELPGGYTRSWSADQKQVTLVFSSGFASNTQYKLKVLPITTDQSGQPVSDIPEITFTSETFDAPRATSFSPSAGSVVVPANSRFVITFDSAMNQAKTNAAISFSPALSSGMNYAWSLNDTRLELTPAANLTFATNYQLNIAQTAERSDGQSMLAAYAISYKTLPQTIVSSISPGDAATSISVFSPIEIVFSQEVDLTSLQSKLKVASGSTVIAGTTSQNGSTAIFVPTAPLPFGSTIRVEVQNGLVDKYGLAVIGKTISFTTEQTDTTNPEIVSSLPVAGSLAVPLNQQFRIEFNKPMNQLSVAGALSLTPPPPGTSTKSWENAGKTLIITNSEPLTHNTSYQLVINTTAKDLGGRALATNYLLSFRSIARPEILLSKCFPQPNATGLALRPEVKIEFSKEMNKTSAQSAFTLKQGTNAIGGAFSWNGNIMSFIPSNDLNSGTVYTIGVNTSARDTTDNYLEAVQTWSFTTTTEEGKTWRLDRAQLVDSGNIVFSPRQDHVMITFASKLWVIGGFDGEYLNDVWSSSNGIAWTKEVAAGTAGMFSARAGHACAVYAGKIWLTGGFSEDSGYFDDVWSSINGKNWVQESASAAYYKRAWHSMQVFANRLWLLGGESFDDNEGKTVLLDDSWSSTDGKIWTERSTITAFFPRKKAMSGVINDKLWVWGGYGENASQQKGVLNDIWSTSNGDFWSLVNANAPFSARCGAGNTLFNNRMWLTGGSSSQEGGVFLNDVWASSDGANWVSILPNNSGSLQQFSPRGFHQSGTLSDRMYLTGGETPGGTLNEVWSSK